LSKDHFLYVHFDFDSDLNLFDFQTVEIHRLNFN